MAYLNNKGKDITVNELTRFMRAMETADNEKAASAFLNKSFAVLDVLFALKEIDMDTYTTSLSILGAKYRAKIKELDRLCISEKDKEGYERRLIC